MEKAIEDIVRTYLRQETDFVHFVSKSNFGPNQSQGPSRQQAQAQTQTQTHTREQVQPQPDKQHQHIQVQVQVPVQEQGTSTSLQSPEKPYGDVGEGHGDAGGDADGDSEQAQLEQDFMRALYQCLEEKGVLKEVQAFIRQRLVLILKGAWPNLVQTKCSTDSHVSLALIQDFLCTHKLLFTFSVFTSEVVTNDFRFREDFGKLRAQDVEAILCELHIPRDSPQSSEILKQYFSKGDCSLLECIIHSSAWRPAENSASNRERPKSAKRRPSLHQPRIVQEFSLIEKLKRIDDNFDKILAKNGANGHSSNVESITDKRVQAMFRELERDKEIQINDRIQRFKRDEVAKIRDEIETLLKFEYLQKEKQLENKNEEKMSQMQKNFDAEREKLFLQKFRQSHELGKGETAGSGTTTAGGDFTGPSEHIHGNFHQSLLAKYNDLVASALPSAGDQVTAFGLKRELERSYLLKEAALRNTIDKLKSENEQLMAAASTGIQESSTDSVVRPQMTKRQPQNRSPPEAAGTTLVPPEDEDARAFLQYTVECQAEQISSLQKQINELIVAKAEKESAEHSPSTPDLQEFLRNSKQRFSEIEQETQQVKARMRQLQVLSSSVPQPPSPRPLRHEEVVHIPRPLPTQHILQSSESLRSPIPSWTRITASGSSSRSNIRLPDRKVHFTEPEHSSLDNGSHFDNNGHVLKMQFEGNPVGIDQTRDDHASSASEVEAIGTGTGLNSSAEAEQKEPPSPVEPENNSYSAAFRHTRTLEKSTDEEHDLSTARSSVRHTNEDVSVTIQEPVAIAKKVYLTGALVREKLTSSSSSSDDHSKSNAADKFFGGSVGSNKSKNGNGNRNGNGGTPARPKSPEIPPGFMPGRSLLLPSQDQKRDLLPNLPSFETSIDDMQFETGKASSSDEDDRLW